MACHEIAALRLSLHTVLGNRPDHEKTHELAELGDVIAREGALKALSEARDLGAAKAALAASALDLEAKVAGMSRDDAGLGYHRALLVNVRSVQQNLDRIIADVERFYQDIEDTHDLLHEVFPDED